MWRVEAERFEREAEGATNRIAKGKKQRRSGHTSGKTKANREYDTHGD